MLLFLDVSTRDAEFPSLLGHWSSSHFSLNTCLFALSFHEGPLLLDPITKPLCSCPLTNPQWTVVSEYWIRIRVVLSSLISAFLLLFSFFLSTSLRDRTEQKLIESSVRNSDEEAMLYVSRPFLQDPVSVFKKHFSA
jgi:hypothetical protein